MKRLLLTILILISFNIYAAEEILTAATGAGNSSKFSLDSGQQVTIIIYAASGHTAGEYSDIQISHDDGTTWADLYYEGSQVRLHSTNTAVTVYGSGIFRVAKEATTNATGVFLSRDGNL
jgi:hypothetical protein